MNLFITHKSALAYWQGPYVRRNDTSEWHQTLPSGTLVGATIDFETLARRGISISPLHVAVAQPKQRTRQAGCTCHIMAGSIPKGAFELLRQGTWVASPELTFCQMATELSFAELVKLGYEFCARFRINGFLETIESCEPLTDPRKLRDFCERFSGNGAKAARAAARYVCANTESPVEIALAILFTLPRMYGGYGLPAAEPNAPIRIASRGPRHSETTFRGDLVWPKQRLIVEYDSNLFHAAPEKLNQDAARRNTLQDAGWRVVTVTSGQLQTPSKTDELAEQLTRALGVSNNYTSAQGWRRRVELRKLLVPWAFAGFEGF